MGDVDFSLHGGAETAADWAKLPRRTQPSTGEVLARQTPQDPRDFLWLMTEEPHRSRRMEILKAHPEVTKLMGHEPLTKWVVFLVVSIQLTAAFLLRNTYPLSWKFLLTAYAVGGTANQNLFLAIHEITHNLAFKNIKLNKALAIIANLPIGIPYCSLFKPYHIEHHKFQGEDGIDTDLPTRAELFCLNNVLGKVFFCTFQILFYALRPGFVRAQKPTTWLVCNVITQIAFDYFLFHLWGRNVLIYFVASSFFAGSLHPCAAHFIAEHFVWDGSDQETYSYYGPLNILAYNVGYHNEHHDFPSVPWTRLPKLRALAPEFYDTLPAHPSWPMVTYNFIMDRDIGIFARAKRNGRGVAKPKPSAAAASTAEDEKPQHALQDVCNKALDADGFMRGKQ